jgi:hypothetical protein
MVQVVRVNCVGTAKDREREKRLAAAMAQRFGGPGRDRTGDLFHAMEARSQLRHRPTIEAEKPKPDRSDRHVGIEGSTVIIFAHITGIVNAKQPAVVDQWSTTQPAYVSLAA